MKRMGKFQGIPVFRVAVKEAMIGASDVIYVLGNKVYFGGEIIADLDEGNNLTGFNQDHFDRLRKKYAARKPKSAETPAESIPERASAESVDIVEDFMSSWRNNIDDEIAVLKNAISAMEDEVSATY